MTAPIYVGKTRIFKKGERLTQSVALFAKETKDFEINGLGVKTTDPKESFGWMWNKPGYVVDRDMIGLYLALDIEPWGEEELCP